MIIFLFTYINYITIIIVKKSILEIMDNLNILLEHIKEHNIGVAQLMDKLDLSDKDAASAVFKVFSDDTLAHYHNEKWYIKEYIDISLGSTLFKKLYECGKYKTCLKHFKSLEKKIASNESYYEKQSYTYELLSLSRITPLLNEITNNVDIKNSYKDFVALHTYLGKFIQKKNVTSPINYSNLTLKVDWLLLYNDLENFKILEKSENVQEIKNSINYILNTNVFRINSIFLNHYCENPEFFKYLLEKDYISMQLYNSLENKRHEVVENFIKSLISETISSTGTVIDFYKKRMSLITKYNLHKSLMDHKKSVTYEDIVKCKNGLFILKNFYEKNETYGVGENNFINEDESKYIYSFLLSLGVVGASSAFYNEKEIKDYIDSIDDTNINCNTIVNVCRSIRLSNEKMVVLEKKLLTLSQDRQGLITEKRTNSFKI